MSRGVCEIMYLRRGGEFTAALAKLETYFFISQWTKCFLYFYYCILLAILLVSRLNTARKTLLSFNALKASSKLIPRGDRDMLRK